MKNSKNLVKLICFNLLILLFACGKEDKIAADGFVKGQKLVQIDSTDGNGNKGAFLKIEYNQADDIDNVFSSDVPVAYYYDKDNILNKSGIYFFGGDRLLDITYGNNEINVNFNAPFFDYSRKFFFNAEGYPIKSGYLNLNGDLNLVDNYVWENGNLVKFYSQGTEVVFEYDDKINPFAVIYNKPFKNPQYLMANNLFPYGRNDIDISKYSKNNVKKIIDRSDVDAYKHLNISYQYNSANLPIEAKYEYKDITNFENLTYHYIYE